MLSALALLSLSSVSFLRKLLLSPFSIIFIRASDLSSNHPAPMAEKVTKMKLKVDLQCRKCYKKVKKVLSKFPQIRDQAFDEKENIVTITVVCCNPEKIRDKLCCKGGGSIKSIEIVEPPKHKPPPEADKKKEGDEKKEADKPKQKEDQKEKPKPDDKPKDPTPKPDDKPKDPTPKPDDKPKDPTPKLPPPTITVPEPPPTAVPVGICCVPCYEGRPGGPCFHGYGGPPPCYDGYYGRPVWDSYGGGRPYYVSGCDQYFSEENLSGCTMM